MISVVIMLFGVTLFFRLAQVLFRPNRCAFPARLRAAAARSRRDPLQGLRHRAQHPGRGAV
jgi:hypothetical protein